MQGLKTRFRFLIVRSLFATAALAGVSAAQATTEVQDNSVLECLQRGARPLQATPGELGAGRGRQPSYLRVKLVFSAPDQPPAVELLANTATAAMQDKVQDYLAQYRLPCLARGAAPVTATQEFHFDPLGDAEGKPLRRVAIASDPARACVLMPKKAPDIPSFAGNGIAKVLVEATFGSDGEAPPKVKVLHADTRGTEYAVLDYLATYRMPCRKAGDAPYTFRQNFTFAFGEVKPARFNEPVVSLQRFLGSVRGIQQQRAYFDFNTMACPFRVQWELLRPLQSNDARPASASASDVQRAEFLGWLKTLELDLPPKQQRALLGESLVIEVSCGVLELGKAG